MRGIAIFLFVFCISIATAKSAKPNIILCMADDHGWADLGFRNRFIHTPNLDQMALEGIQFDRWYAASPVCSPTRGSCLTGRHPHRYGIFSANVGHMKQAEITLAEVLKEAGYVNGHFGKWHLGTLSKTRRDANRGGTPEGFVHYSPPWENGFDECFSTESKVPTFDPMHNPNSISREAKKDRPEGAFYGTAYWTGEGKRVPENQLRGDDSKLIMDRSLRFISQAVQNAQPFFAVIWFHAPHTPVVAKDAHRRLYPDHPFGLYGQHYHGCISALDEQMGRLRKHLQILGISDETMLWYSSDNGPEGSAKNAAGSAKPFRGRKRSLYEGGVRVPAMLVWGNRVKPKKVSEPCISSDYFPTILEILDIPLPPRPYDGTSLLPIIDGKSFARKPICFQFKKLAAIHSEQFKLISIQNGARWELYDLLEDPSESRNIASEHPLKMRALREQLLAWIQSCKNSNAGKDYKITNGS